MWPAQPVISEKGTAALSERYPLACLDSPSATEVSAAHNQSRGLDTTCTRPVRCEQNRLPRLIVSLRS